MGSGSQRPRCSRPLPADSPFGEVVVDRDSCTLCLACVNLCPTQALVTRAGTVPTLSLIEANCVQCGICEEGCPEKAITLQPRFEPDAARRGARRLLNEDELARCTSCGTPFIAAKLLASGLARMKDFPGLSDLGGVERLKCCPACRQRACLDA